MFVTKEEFNSYEGGISKQWLLTNGIGGFASSNINGCNTKKYHGLLIAPMDPPHQRMLLVSKINETIKINNQSYDISTNECVGYISEGYKYQTAFRCNPFPTFEFKVGNTVIKKDICMIHGENTTVVRYEIITSGHPVDIDFTPLTNYRDFHTTNYNPISFLQIKTNDNGLKLLLDSERYLYIYSNCEEYEILKSENYNNMYYRNEDERGLDCKENQYMPGIFKTHIESNTIKQIYFYLSTEPQNHFDVNESFDKEQQRQTRLIEKAGLYDEYANKLVLSADQFIIADKNEDYGIIAGYPWFDVWGRDTFISFEGLLLVTKRFDIAKNILTSSLNHVKNGIIPNTYNNSTSEGLYNSVDASLWYFEALYRYLKYTKDYTIINKQFYEKLVDIIMAYNDGTDFNIHVDKADGLLVCGSLDTNLTWMDAKYGDNVFTPRNGKCVEINALWYNALNIMIELSKYRTPNGAEYMTYEHLATRCKDSFEKKFWNSSKNCLYDTIEPFSLEIRPNQLIALSLSFPIYMNSNAKIMLDTVQEHLYTPYGMRTLSPYSKEYIGTYHGDSLQRDSAYHQGSVWVWLLSEYIISFCKINKYSLSERKSWIQYIKVLKENINDDCINQISEIFDGDMPHKPNGAFAQAWSVGNILKLFSEVE